MAQFIKIPINSMSWPSWHLKALRPLRLSPICHKDVKQQAELDGQEGTNGHKAHKMTSMPVSVVLM